MSMSIEQQSAATLGIEIEEYKFEGEPVKFPRVSQNQLAFEDIFDGFKQWRIWFMLAYQDIKLRYRRSILGPLWITLSMAITVYSMGFLYAHIFHTELEKYFPFLVSGMLCWSLISGIILDFTDGLATSDGLMKQIKLPFTLYVQRVAARNYLIFFHNILVIIPILAIFHAYAKVNLNTLLIFPGLFVLYINAISFGVIISMVGARYRDVSQIIKSMVQIIFFVTPVIWGPEVLGPGKQFIVDLNPFYAFLEIIRAPMIGHVPTLKNVIAVAIVTSFGLFVSFKMFSRYRSRIIYWI